MIKNLINKIKYKLGYNHHIIRERRVVNIFPITNNPSSSFSDFTVIVLCDDDTMWMCNNRDLDLKNDWKQLKSIPKF